MPGMDEKLSKSLEEISAKADEMIKSLDVQPSGEEPKADEISKGQNQNAGQEAIVKGEEPSNSEEEEKKDDPNGDDADQGEDKDPRPDGGIVDTQKSFAEMLKDNETIQKSIDASDFLNEWSQVHTATIDGLRTDLEKSLGASNKTAEVLAKSLNAVLTAQENIIKSQSTLAKSFAELASRMEVVERTPAGRKSVENINVIEKSFNRSAGVEGDGAGELSKSETLTRMTDMVMKGIPGVSVQDVVDYESSSRLSPHVRALLTKN